MKQEDPFPPGPSTEEIPTIGFKPWPLISAFKEAKILWPSVIKRRWHSLIFVLWIDYLSQYIFFLSSQHFGWMNYENPLLLIITNISQAFIHLLLINAWTLILVSSAEDIIYKRPSRDWQALLIQYFQQMIIENLRYIAAILWRFPFLIIPAGIASIRMSFFNFVVVADTSYDRGERDALKRSQNLTRGHFFTTAVAIVFVSLTPELIETSLQPEGPNIVQSPLWVLASQIGFFISQTYLLLYFYSLYLNLSHRLDSRRDSHLPSSKKDVKRTQDKNLRQN